MKPALVLFVKEPRPGFVKTRLGLPPDQATRLYRAFCRDTLRACRLAGLERWIAYDTRDGANPAWLDGKVDFFRQEGRDLGQRLEHAFQKLRARGRLPIALGTDSPGLPPEYLKRAAVFLAEKDLVLGPAMDGGYYLIGMRRAVPEFLAGIAWSTAEVFPETIARARRHGLSVGLLPPFPDIDRRSDLERWLAWRPKAPAPATRRALRMLRLPRRRPLRSAEKPAG